jgi:hypothetical protein
VVQGSLGAWSKADETPANASATWPEAWATLRRVLDLIEGYKVEGDFHKRCSQRSRTTCGHWLCLWIPNDQWLLFEQLICWQGKNLR